MRSLKLGGMGFFDVCFLHRRELDCPSRERLKQFHQKVADCEIAVAAHELHGTELSFKLADRCIQNLLHLLCERRSRCWQPALLLPPQRAVTLPDLLSARGLCCQISGFSATAGRA